jgi:hypothetical protein
MVEMMRRSDAISCPDSSRRIFRPACPCFTFQQLTLQFFQDATETGFRVKDSGSKYGVDAESAYVSSRYVFYAGQLTD